MFTWNLLDLKRVKWEAPQALAPGKHTIVYRLQIRRSGLRDARLQQHERPWAAGDGRAQRGRQGSRAPDHGATIPLILPWDETFDIGADTGTPVDDADYQIPFAFTGKIDKLTFALTRPC